MDKAKIDLPIFATFTMACEGKETALVVVPRRGCDMCFLKNYTLCLDMCCCADERKDGEAVQFIDIQATASPLVLHTEAILEGLGMFKEKRDN